MTPLHERRASPFDFQCRVGVGMGDVPTMDALEDRLALAASGVNDTTVSARLGRERGGDIDQPAPCGFELVIEHGGELPPALSKNGSVQACLLADVPTWVFDCAFRAPRHALDVQILKSHHPETKSDEGAADVQMVRSHPGDLCVCAGSGLLVDATACGTLFRPSHGPLRRSMAPLQMRDARERNVFPGRQTDRIRHPAINANGRPAVDQRRFADIRNESHNPAGAFAGHGDRLRIADDRPRQPKLQPAQVTPKQHCTPLRVQNFERGLLRFKPDAVVQAKPSHRRVTGGSLEERGEGPVEIVKSGFLRYPRGLSDPVEIPSQVRKFAALARHGYDPALGRFELTPEVSPLLQGQIVNEPRDADPLAERLGLVGRRVQPKFEAAMHGGNLAQNTRIAQ